MATSVFRIGEHDRQRIDVYDVDAVSEWADLLGVSKHDLMQAIEAVGDRPDAIERHLAAHAETPPLRH